MQFKQLRAKFFTKSVDFAAALGENISTVNMWENGTKRIRLV